MTDSDGDRRNQSDGVPPQGGLFGGLTSQQVIRPLWLVLLGAVLCSISYGIAVGPKLHLSPQPIGAILLTLGIWQLSTIDVGPDYAWRMRATLLVGFLWIVTSLSDTVWQSTDPLVTMLHIFLVFASIAASVSFAFCIGWFCQDMRLWRSARRWRWTTIVFSCAGAVFALLEFFLLLAVLKVIQIPASAGIPWLWWYLLAVPFIVGPPLAMILCILQMEREMRRRHAREAVENVALAPLLKSSGD